MDDCVTAYERIMAPENYQRPKSIVTKRMIEEAQKKVQELGLMDSLPRRHAALEDITVNNVIFANRDCQEGNGRKHIRGTGRRTLKLILRSLTS